MKRAVAVILAALGARSGMHRQTCALESVRLGDTYVRLRGNKYGASKHRWFH